MKTEVSEKKTLLKEDFDFGKIKGHRIEDDYTFTPEQIRQAIKVDPLEVCNKLFGCTLPKKIFKFIEGREDDFDFLCDHKLGIYRKTAEYSYRTGRKTCDKIEDELIEHGRIIGKNITNKFKTYHYQHYFKETKRNGDNGYPDDINIPDFVLDILDIIHIQWGNGYENASMHDLIKMDDVEFELWYKLSDDEGIIIITYYKLQIYDRFKNAIYISSLRPLIAYTGKCAYAVEKKPTKIGVPTFMSNWFHVDGYDANFSIYNNHIIATAKVNKRQPWHKQHSYYKTLFNNTEDFINKVFFMSNEYWAGLYNPSRIEGVYDIDLFHKKISEDLIILKKYNHATNNLIAGYTSPNKNICFYIISDYNVLVKLIGENNASLATKETFNFKTKDNPDVEQTIEVYPLLYVTDKGMELFKKAQNYEIPLADLKNYPI